jgi:hypothetical protein
MPLEMKVAPINPLLETFYRVKSFARTIRRNVTPLQNWLPVSLPKNFNPWVSDVSGNKSSRTWQRVWQIDVTWL